MDKVLSNFLEQREHTVLTDIDVITAAELLISMGFSAVSIGNRVGHESVAGHFTAQ